MSFLFRADDGTADPPQRAVLTPIAWAVMCPCCGAENGVERTREDDAGAIHADGTDQFFHCASCDTFIEVAAVSVQEAYPA